MSADNTDYGIKLTCDLDRDKPFNKHQVLIVELLNTNKSRTHLTKNSIARIEREIEALEKEKEAEQKRLSGLRTERGKLREIMKKLES